MKISLDWLSDFVTFASKDPQEIARRITISTAEVEEIEVQGALLEECCIGKVLSLAKHPNADRLWVCDVQTNRGVKKVVCGGTNLRVGMRVAFAHVGTTLRWHGTHMQTLEKVAIRGVESEGMICTAEELDLLSTFPESRERILIDLGDGDEGVGMPLRDFPGLHDTVLHIDNNAIAHRPDLFSHIGFARECVAVGIAHWKKKKAISYQLSAFGFPKEPLPFHCINDIPHLIPRYCSCLLQIGSLGETPAWMKRRLIATGWRPVNLPVDITNYVSMETGMPLHSFDADDLHGDIHMRLSQESEPIVTLDGVDRTLPAGAIVISDEQGVFDLLGIMGGLRSSTKETTRRIYLHAAILDPVTIRRTILATGHRTEASTVYEKGVPRIAATQGFARALELFLNHVPGARIVSRLESHGTDGTPKPIPLHHEHIEKVLGVAIPPKKVVKILSSLAFRVAGKRTKDIGHGKGHRPQVPSPKSFKVTSPLHRLRDIHGEHDLIEEVGRIAGYDAIQPVTPRASIHPPPQDTRIHLLREALKGRGYSEIVPLSLTSAALLSQCAMDPHEAVEIENPLGEDLQLLQMSTLTALLTHAQRNLLYAEETLQTFHWGNVFRRGEEEHLELTVLLTRRNESDILHEPFLILKQHLLSALSSLGLTCNTVRDVKPPPPFAHPGRTTGLECRGKRIGLLYELHPSIRERFDLRERAAAATLDLSLLFSLRGTSPIAAEPPQFPAVSYDITVTLDHHTESRKILERIKQGSDLLESVHIADLYTAPSQERSQYKLTLRCTYRATDRTLTEAEAQRAHASVLRVLERMG